MDAEKFAAFLVQLRKEKGLTQKELADLLHVTDKAVSKWETARGFPDIKLLEPLARALGVSLVELLQGERQTSPTLTTEEADAVVSQAMDQSQKVTALRYLRLFRWVLTGLAAACALVLLPQASLWLYMAWFSLSHNLGIIGGADGPTAVITVYHVTPDPPAWLTMGLPALGLVLSVIFAVKVGRLERKLK